MAVILLLILVTSWSVDGAVGHGNVALLAGGAGALFAAIVAPRIRTWTLRLAAAAVAGSIAAVALATWQAQVAASGTTLGELGAGLEASVTAAWAGRPVGTVGMSLALAILAWANAYAATTGLLTRERLRGTVALLGGPLLAAMLVAPTLDIGLLVLFAAGTMLLNLWLAQQRRDVGWRRRALSLEGDVADRIRRAGTFATLGVVVLAWVLATVAIGAPLHGLLRGAESFLRDTTSSLGGWQVAGLNAGAPVFAGSFGIGDEWQPTDEPVLVVQGHLSQPYLRAITYDRFTGTGWSQALAPPRQVAAGEPLFRAPSLELGIGWRESEVARTITAEQSFDTLILPIGSSSVSRTVELEETAGAHFVAAFRSSVDAGATYEVTGSDAVASPVELAAAGDAYPAALPDSYRSLDGVTLATTELAAQVAGQGTPYAKAAALAAYLQSFSYQNRVHIPAGANVVDWLLFDPAGQAGFCQQYASAMVVMARAVGIPARLARGYAGGERQADGTVLFREADSHVWAELYFPGYGWQVFEATPGKHGPDRSAAREVPTPGESAAATRPERSQRELTDITDPNAQQVPRRQLPVAAILGVLMALALGAAAIAMGLLRTRRAPTDLTPMQVWHRLTVAGERAGIPRRSSQTPYEYAAMLQRHVPDRSREIASIAGAVVVATYAPTGDRSSPAPEEWMGLRRALTRLELRRRLNTLRGHRDG